MPMNESLFSALRIATIALSSDGKIAPKEEKWFLLVLRMYDLSPDQRATLRNDLKNPADITEIFRRVVRREDRERLLGLLRTASHSDGELHPEEKRLYDQIKALTKEDEQVSSTDYHGYATGLLQIDKETRMWKDLEEVGKFYQRPYYGFGYGWYSWAHLICISFIAMAFSKGNRTLAGFTILLLLFLAALYWLSSSSPR